ncbi:MAG: PIN domain-containing protein, partial [Candidatus Bipolaricaulota bacterium]|nr:PIN domain-containing protein [Candidatus Bipolaricaulota bacterium]
KRATELGKALLESHVLRRLYIDESLERAAWTFFKEYDDQDFSFTDCTSFAVMTAEKITKAFTFDRDFQIAGFQVLP